MPYAVEITLAEPPSADGDDALPMYLLPETFDTVGDAKAAAEAHIAGLPRDPATVFFAITDQNGLTVTTSAKQAG
ncbi:hypothetical protein [Methylobacterium sp. Leaf466]|uniref:hypothetical protein n=1 Tax=Methylobacterium sp. Leaf466 TaxID=1736386 RepID=UPI0007009F05|nr:hypothetical protein [Methylobacterium sp. Leaf466]KQT78217.1 hypothetical protein ASG59_09575 [Methylobacterium sp. Leaf466]